MKTLSEYVFEHLILEAGAEAGKLELVKTKLQVAKDHATLTFGNYDRELVTELPNFDKNYEFAKSKASIGKTQRKDMPVIDDVDVKLFQQRLLDGNIDISQPFKNDKVAKNPFPEGLTKAMADEWLTNGLKIYDGHETDDVVKVQIKSISVGDLKPIQKQIYFDKSIESIARWGIKGAEAFMSTTTFICSTDNFIIDGHHRFLSCILINPKMKVNCLVIDLPISKLLPLSLSYGDAIGNKRNL